MVKGDGFPPQQHLTGVGLVGACQAFGQRGLPAAVFAHQRMDLSLDQRAGHILQRLHGVECLADIPQLPQRWRIVVHKTTI